jgi:hypothetical protein
MGDKRPVSKKKAPVTSIKGKKGVDESEKLLIGNGWTIAATQKLLELTTDVERLQHLLQMFSISEHDYQYDVRSTNQIDFHFANFLFCVDKAFDLPKVQFVCRTLHKLLTQGIARVQGSASDTQIPYDVIRVELFDALQAAFVEQNTTENPVNLEEAKSIISFTTMTFFRPLRLVLYPFYLSLAVEPTYALRKIFQPVQPVPLAECEEFFPVIDEARDFKPFPLAPTVTTMNLEDVKQMIQRYTDDVIDTIERRYDMLEEQIAKVAPVISPRGP